MDPISFLGRTYNQIFGGSHPFETGLVLAVALVVLAVVCRKP